MVGCSCLNFNTFGAYTWYGFLQNLPKECIQNEKYDKNRNKKTRKHGVQIPTLMFRNESNEEEFIR